VEELAERFSRSTIVITTDYTGLGVDQMTELRRALRERDVEFRVIKNSLALLAADAAGKPEVKEVIEGPTGIAFGYGDASVPAKALADFIRTTKYALTIRGAELDGRVLDTEQVQQLARLPGRDELMAQLLSRMQSPITGLVQVLNGPIAGLARVLRQHADNLAQQA
jgi:large subunit ribosomal protein L10